MAESGGPAIGIDLGTTNSCVGVWMNDRVEIIINEQGKRTTPSYVAFDDFQRLIGDNAKRQAGVNPTNTIYDVKRLIGRKFSDEIVQNDLMLWPFRVVNDSRNEPEIIVIHRGQEKRMTPVQISAMVLERMREIATDRLGCPVKNAVITVPAYFSDSQRQATMDAGVIAGLNVMRIINEPTAAAIAYGLDKKSDTRGRRTVLVFDLGGGTLDVSLLSIYQGNIEVKATNGDSHLGGEDFDNRMVNYFVDEFAMKKKKDIKGNPKAIRRLRENCEEAKILLSEAQSASLSIDCLYDGIDFSSSITRATFVRINGDLFRKCMQAVENCLTDAKMEKSDVDEVVLVGGSTRIPEIQQLLREFFKGKQLRKNINPDEAVAQGAAIQAAMMTGKFDGNLRNFNVSDVTPLSIALETDSGEATVLIPKNKKIPTEKKYVCPTVENDQTKMKIHVYEGEGVDIATRRNLIGSIEINDIPPAPKGSQKFSLFFQINSNGILTMTKEDQTNGSRDNRNKTTITIERRTMSEEEIRKNIRQNEKYKAEDEEHRRCVKAKNALETYVFNMQNSMDNVEDVGREDKKTLENVILDVNKWFGNVEIASVDDYEKRLEELNSVCYKIINKTRETRKGKLHLSSTSSRSNDIAEDMTIRHWSHNHDLKLLPLETPRLCNGCQVLVFKPCYQCDENDCNYWLHEECAMASSKSLHPFFRDCEFEFYESYKNPYNETCDGCGKDLKGFVYQCNHKKPHKLHPGCLKLEKTLVGHGVILHLNKKSSSKCAKCGEKEVLKGFKGWSYVSSDGTCSYHVACVKDLFFEQWKENKFYGSPSGKGSVMENPEMRITVPSKKTGEVSIWKTAGKIVKNATIALSLILSALFGGPFDSLVLLAQKSLVGE